MFFPILLMQQALKQYLQLALNRFLENMGKSPAASSALRGQIPFVFLLKFNQDTEYFRKSLDF